MEATGGRIQGFEVVAYEPRYGPAFRDLNLAWIERYFEVEDADRRQLMDPQGSILDRGGAIFIGLMNELPVACCALQNEGGGVYELSKMAVDESMRGKGIGRAMLAEVIERSRTLGAVRLTIVSNTILESAIHLYQDAGFFEVPLVSEEYARSNIAMELDLRDSPAAT